MTSLDQRVDDLFLEVVDLPADRRAALLHERAETEPDLVQGVLSLIAADEANADGALEGSAHAIKDTDRPFEIDGFRLGMRIGRGGMGEVFRAEQKTPRRAVALKLIRPGLASPETIQRFKLEIEFLGRLRHPNITQIHAAGVGAARYRDGIAEHLYIAMELIDGDSILEHCSGGTTSDIPRTLDLMAQVADGVQHAHESGIIHRDLKPANILVDRRGVPKVLDFGAARLMDNGQEQQPRWTVHGQIVGTPHYMSPEQAAGDPGLIDARTDIYSLGAILYELLGGRTPHGGGDASNLAVLRRVESGTPVRLEKLRPGVSRDLATVVHCALGREPADRYRSAQQLAGDLRAVLEERPIQARALSRTYLAAKFIRRHRGLVTATAVVVLLLSCAVIGLSYFAAQSDRERVRADRSSYLNSMRSVAFAIDTGRAEHSRAQLEQIGEPLRGWEWTHLMSRAPRPRHTWQLEGDELHTSLRVEIQFNEAGTRAALAYEIKGQGAQMTTWSLVGDRDPSTSTLDHLIEDGTGFRDLGTAVRFAPLRAIVPLTSSPSSFRIHALRGEHSDVALDSATLDSLMVLDRPPGTPSEGTPIAVGWRDGVAYVHLPAVDARPSVRGRVAGWSPLRSGALAAVPHTSPTGASSTMVAVVDVDSRIDVHSMVSGAHLASFENPAGWSDWEFTPDGTRLVAATEDGDLCAWETATFEPLWWSPIRDVGSGIKCIDISGDGTKVATGGSTGLVRQRALDTGNVIDSHGEFSSLVLAVAYTPDDSTLISVDEQGRVCERSALGADPWVLRGHSSYVYPVAVSPSGAWIGSGSWDSTVRIWESRTAVPMATIRLPATDGTGTHGPFFDLEFTPDEERIVTVASNNRWGGANSISVVNLRTGEVERSVAAGRMASIVMHPHDDLVVVADDAGVSVRGLYTWKELRHTPLRCVALAASATGDPLLAVADRFSDDPALVVLRLDDLELVNRLPLETAEISSAAFSADGTKLAVSTFEGASVWDPSDGRLLARLDSPEPRVHAVAFSPDGSRIATGADDGLLRIWDADMFDLRAELLGHDSYIYSLRWSATANMLVSGSGDGTVRLWDHRDRRAWWSARRTAVGDADGGR